MNKGYKRPKVPYCYSCYDKGYNSYLAVEHTASDFEMGERGGDKTFEKRRYCGCKGGQRLKRLESLSPSFEK